MRLVKAIWKFWPALVLSLIVVGAVFQMAVISIQENAGTGLLGAVPAFLFTAGVPLCWSGLRKSTLFVAFAVGLVIGVLTFAAALLSPQPVAWGFWGGSWCLAACLGFAQVWLRGTAGFRSEILAPLTTEVEANESPAAQQIEATASRSVWSNDAVEDEDEEEVTQSWNRVKLADGSERVEGSLVLTFAEGEQIKHFHVPVSPPFASRPTVWCELDDESCRLSFTQLQTYGVRLTVRRSAAALEPQVVEATVVLSEAQGTQAVA